MPSTRLYPLLFTPVYRTAIWGGSRIGEAYNRPDLKTPCAESWEISDRPEGMCIVRNGPLAGRSLGEVHRDLRKDLFGNHPLPRTRIPLLIKIIDAEQRLSVQVHPDEASCRVYGGEPKTEMWYVLAADPGSCVYAGLKPGTTPQKFDLALSRNAVESLLAKIPVKPGMAIFIPGGLVHAIGEGCLLLEIQQSSNTTYRVYDWGRLGEDGNPRDLHVEQARNVINWKLPPPVPSRPVKLRAAGGNTLYRIIESPYFRVARLDLTKPEAIPNDGRSFHVVFVEKGNLAIDGGGRSETMTSGTTCMVPAGLREYTLTPGDEPASAILVSLV